MKNIFAGLFAKTKKPQGVTQQPKDVSAGLRSMVLNLSPAEIGLTPSSFPHQVWGIIMETGMRGGYYTLAVLADGDVPPLLSSTKVWSPIPHLKEIGREEALFRRTDHRLPA